MPTPDLDYCHSGTAKTSGTGPEFYLFQRAATSRSERVADPSGFYEGPDVQKMECRVGDMSGLSPGTERVEAQGHRVLTFGTEYWWETDLWIPTSVPKVTSAGFLTLMSTFGGPGSGSSPFRWDIKGDRFGCSTAGNDRAWQESSANAKANIYGKWVTMRCHSKLSSSESAKDGWIEAWLRVGETPMKQLTFWKPGETQNLEGHTANQTKWTFNSIEDIYEGPHVKIDQYRRASMEGWGSETIYFTSLRVASSAELVANPFGFTYDGEVEPEPSRPSAIIQPQARSRRGLALR